MRPTPAITHYNVRRDIIKYFSNTSTNTDFDFLYRKLKKYYHIREANLDDAKELKTLAARNLAQLVHIQALTRVGYHYQKTLLFEQSITEAKRAGFFKCFLCEDSHAASTIYSETSTVCDGCRKLLERLMCFQENTAISILDNLGFELASIPENEQFNEDEEAFPF